jgi:hypothetical protein
LGLIYEEAEMIKIFITATALAATALVAGAQPLPQPKVGPCPSGYTESGGYCAPTSDRAPAAIPKRGQCPSNCTQSGGAAGDLV